MADPTKYNPEYSYSAWQASNPTKPLPAPQVDNDMANISRSVNETIDALRDVRRSDGALQNGIVTFDAMESSLSALIAAVPGLAQSAADSAQLAGNYANQSANWANRSQDSANAAEAAAQRALENATQLVIATKDQAEAGVVNDKGMTPLRTAQAIRASTFALSDPAQFVPLFQILKSAVDPEWRNPSGRWNDDDTAVLQASIQEAADENRTLKLRRTYTVDGLVLFPRVRIEGDATKIANNSENDGAGLRLKRNATATALLRLNDQANQTIWNRAGVELYNFALFGDKNFQTGLVQGLNISHEGGSGGGSMIPRHKVSGLIITDFSSDGLEIGPFTRDSFFEDLIIYGSMGYGVKDGGVDGYRRGWNVGQSYKDGIYCTGAELIYSDMKSWGSGQYNLTNPGSVAGWDPTTSSNFYFFKSYGMSANNLKSQEASASGFRIEGQGANLLRGFVGLGFDSDGDCRMNSVSGSRAAINIFRAPGLLLTANVDKRNPAFVGGPYYGLAISTESGGGDITLNTNNTSSVPMNAGSGGEANNFNVNGNKGRVFSTSAISSYTPLPLDAEIHAVAMGDSAITIQNPSRKWAGLKLKLILTQNATGGRVINFGTDFKVSWTPDTSGGKTNVIEFVSDGTYWIQTSSAVGL